MRAFWDTISGLNYEHSIWIEQEDLGKEKVIKLKNKRHTVMMPHHMNKDVVIRLRGLGKTKNNKTGDLLLHIWLNKGNDEMVHKWVTNCWD
jgi:hypothetical protein